MALLPYPDLTLRRAKVLKHVFSTAEGWWAVLDGLLPWRHDWDTLRVAGCFNAPAADTHPIAQASEAVDEVLTRRHDDWLRAAERAAAQARSAGGDRVTAQPDGRQRLIGDEGVVVVIAAQSRLVTCWREPDGTSAAVRRAERRASLNQPPPTRR